MELFGRTGQVAEFLESCPERQITFGKRRYTYKKTVVNVQGWGRRQIIAIYRGHGVWKYYVSNNLRATIFTLLKRLKDRWSVEDTHRSLKNFHGGEHFYVWSETSVRGHFEIAYLSTGLAYLECFSQRKIGQTCTIESIHYKTLQQQRINAFQHYLPKLGGIQ